ncbi:MULTISPECIES: DUF805 domain-containing protein [Streptomyces]|uniref:Uncharacterized membrane protein YhaH (DUF805 family) n=1 Tax=Streptomyces nymphaeiformis TaxID=2663842 RepID=A0A7W7U0D4_9ACTN|nr:DUF805 domain-containing protein [Streptomyces nymphaeiformis]MBB4981330.1 uncharacterized membrane protein YhaH (DUF805 family) [Streptomyces nymphaeiformis]
MNWYLDVLKKYAVFSGRARRTEHWMFFLVNAIAVVVVVAIDLAIGTFPLLWAVYFLAVFLPHLGVMTRRLHDTGRSGWWLLIALVPLVGCIVLIVFLATEGEQRQNAYGPDPKAVPAAA